MKRNLIATHIQAMEGYVPGEQPRVADVVKLNTNENPYPPSPAVARALASFDPATLRRYPDPMATALRARIAEMNGTTPDHVFAGNGSDEVLALATRCFVPDGGAVGCFWPTYSLYPVLAKIRNVRCVETPLGDDFGWRTPPPSFRPDLFFLTNPNAPTGILYPEETVRAFADAFDGVVLVDEAYADFADGNCMALATRPDNRNVIVSRTLSKSFSLAGLRFGYCIGPTDLIDALYKAKDSYNLDAVTQALALAALNDLDYMRANVARIRAARHELAAALSARGWQAPESQTNFLLARPPGGDAAGTFARLRAKNVFVRYFPAPPTTEFLRITIGTPQENAKFLAACDA